MHGDHSDLSSRVANLEAEMKGIREEVALNRTRYHELSTTMAPILLESNEIGHHEAEIREIRSVLDQLSGVWTSIITMAIVVSLLVAGSLLSYLHLL